MSELRILANANQPTQRVSRYAGLAEPPVTVYNLTSRQAQLAISTLACFELIRMGDSRLRIEAGLAVHRAMSDDMPDVDPVGELKGALNGIKDGHEVAPVSLPPAQSQFLADVVSISCRSDEAYHPMTTYALLWDDLSLQRQAARPLPALRPDRLAA